MITSTSSSQVKYVVNLQKKSKLRKEEKQFVVEGIKMVSEAPTDRLVKVYISETFKADNEEFLERMNYDAFQTSAAHCFFLLRIFRTLVILELL